MVGRWRREREAWTRRLLYSMLSAAPIRYYSDVHHTAQTAMDVREEVEVKRRQIYSRTRIKIRCDVPMTVLLATAGIVWPWLSISRI
jgi:hypothetical protein